MGFGGGSFFLGFGLPLELRFLVVGCGLVSFFPLCGVSILQPGHTAHMASALVKKSRQHNRRLRPTWLLESLSKT